MCTSDYLFQLRCSVTGEDWLSPVSSPHKQAPTTSYHCWLLLSNWRTDYHRISYNAIYCCQSPLGNSSHGRRAASGSRIQRSPSQPLLLRASSSKKRRPWRDLSPPAKSSLLRGAAPVRRHPSGPPRHPQHEAVPWRLPCHPVRQPGPGSWGQPWRRRHPCHWHHPPCRPCCGQSS